MASIDPEAIQKFAEEAKAEAVKVSESVTPLMKEEGELLDLARRAGAALAQLESARSEIPQVPLRVSTAARDFRDLERAAMLKLSVVTMKHAKGERS